MSRSSSSVLQRYVALLKGVNVGGHNKLPMAGLRALVEELGYGDVSTYIQSGNVLFSGTTEPDASRFVEAIARTFAIDTAVAIRSAADLEGVLANNPFCDVATAQLHVGFLAGETVSLDGVDVVRFIPERCCVVGRDVYFHLPRGMGVSKLPAYLARRLPVPLTVRNWRTVTTLAELSRGPGI